MQVLIKQEFRNLKVTSVIISHDADDPHGYRLKMFFCPNCQNPIFQFKGHIAKILPGEIPIELPIVIKCSNKACGQIYEVKAL